MKNIICWRCGTEIKTSSLDKVKCEHCKIELSIVEEKILEGKRFDHLTRRIHNIEQALKDNGIYRD